METVLRRFFSCSTFLTSQQLRHALRLAQQAVELAKRRSQQALADTMYVLAAVQLRLDRPREAIATLQRLSRLQLPPEEKQLALRRLERIIKDTQRGSLSAQPH